MAASKDSTMYAALLEAVRVTLERHAVVILAASHWTVPCAVPTLVIASLGEFVQRTITKPSAV
jgi:hypothetical protein